MKGNFTVCASKKDHDGSIGAYYAKLDTLDEAKAKAKSLALKYPDYKIKISWTNQHGDLITLE